MSAISPLSALPGSSTQVIKKPIHESFESFNEITAKIFYSEDNKLLKIAHSHDRKSDDKKLTHVGTVENKINVIKDCIAGLQYQLIETENKRSKKMIKMAIKNDQQELEFLEGIYKVHVTIALNVLAK